jgi:hypothetical protein
LTADSLSQQIYNVIVDMEQTVADLAVAIAAGAAAPATNVPAALALIDKAVSLA